MPEPNELTAAEAARAIAERSVTAVELAQACLDRIEALDDRLLAWVYVDRDTVLNSARAADAAAPSASRTSITPPAFPLAPAAKCTRTSCPNSMRHR